MTACEQEKENDAWATTLRSCYLHFLDQAWPDKNNSWLDGSQPNCGHVSPARYSWTMPTLDIVATPVLGAGARKAPFDNACRVAAEAVVSWAQKRSSIPISGDNFIG